MMKVLMLLTAVVCLIGTVHAGCKPTDDVGVDYCQANSGSCSTTLRLAGEGSSAFQSLTTTLRYGNYCGSGVLCNTGNSKGVPNVAPCKDDGLDEACQVHDTCIYDAGGAPGQGVEPPESACPCHAALIEAALVANTPGNLCDQAFYDATDGTGITEGIFVAAGFCCLFTAGGFCDGILDTDPSCSLVEGFIDC